MSKRKHDCPEMVDLIADYLEEELDAAQRQKLELHLDLCPPCKNFLMTYKQTGQICRDVLKREMPDELKANLRGFLNANCCGKSHSSKED